MENDGYQVELIMPKHEKADMWNQLKKRGPMPYHICYLVDDIEKEIAKLSVGNTGKEYKLLSPPTAAPAIGGKQVAFLYNKDIGLIELAER